VRLENELRVGAAPVKGASTVAILQPDNFAEVGARA
jgi:hypothetical protein